MSSRADKYIVPSAVAAFGGLLIVAPLFLKAPSDYNTYAANDKVHQSEIVNRNRIKQRKETATILQQTGLLPEGRTVRLTNYDDSPTRPPQIRRQTLERYLADEAVVVYDRSGTCIGVIQNRSFTWKRNDAKACKNIPVTTEDN